MFSRKFLTAASLCLAVLVSAPIVNARQGSNDSPGGPPVGAEATTDTLFLLNRPSEVLSWWVVCADALVLDALVADAGVAGDHWEVKIKVFDRLPHQAIAVDPGGVNAFSAPARVWGFGAVRQPDGMNALVQVRYLHGLNDFPAAGTLRIVSFGGTCTPTLTALPVDDERLTGR